MFVRVGRMSSTTRDIYWANHLSWVLQHEKTIPVRDDGFVRVADILAGRGAVAYDASDVRRVVSQQQQQQQKQQEQQEKQQQRRQNQKQQQQFELLEDEQDGSLWIRIKKEK